MPTEITRPSEILKTIEAGDIARLRSLLPKVDLNHSLPSSIEMSLASALGNEVTPLMFAAYCGQFDVVRFLLESKADPNTKSAVSGAIEGYSDCALAYCVWSEKPNRYAIMKVLLEAGADLKPASSQIMTRIVMLGDLELANLAIEHGIDRNEFLWNGALQGSLPLVELLLRQGADPNYVQPPGPFTDLWPDNTVFGRAVGSGKAEIVQALVRGGAKPPKDLLTHLRQWCASHEDTSMVNLLKELGA